MQLEQTIFVFHRAILSLLGARVFYWATIIMTALICFDIGCLLMWTHSFDLLPAVMLWLHKEDRSAMQMHHDNMKILLPTNAIFYVCVIPNNSEAILVSQTNQQCNQDKTWITFTYDRSLFFVNIMEDFRRKHNIEYHWLSYPKPSQPLSILMTDSDRQTTMVECFMKDLSNSLNTLAISETMEQPENMTIVSPQYTALFKMGSRLVMKRMTYHYKVSWGVAVMYKLGTMVFFMMTLYYLMMMAGLAVRFGIIGLLTVYLVADAFFRRRPDRQHKRWGWIYQQLTILLRRLATENAGQSPRQTFIIIIQFIAANVGYYLLMLLSCKLFLINLMADNMAISWLTPTGYSMIKALLFCEFMYYIFARSRTTLIFYPAINCLMTLILYIYCGHPSQTTYIIWPLRIYWWSIVTSTCAMLACEAELLAAGKSDPSSQLETSSIPSVSRPRMLFHAGYDIDWEKMVPPLWTYFTKVFQLSSFSSKERCLIDRDYELLYGALLGLDERQELPEEADPEDQEDDEGQVHVEMMRPVV